MSSTLTCAMRLLSIGLLLGGCGNDDGRVAPQNNDDDAPAPPAPDASSERNQHCEPEFSGPIDPTELIDDLEDRDGFIAQTGGRNGGWSVYSDNTGGTLEPAAGSNRAPARIVGGRCGSAYAMRVTGQGFTDWGAGVNIGFRYENDDLAAFDASRYSGIRFWARVGETNTSAIRVQLQDLSTYPVGGVCDPNDLLGASACYNGHGTGLVPLATEWRLYEIVFDRLSQRDLFGSPSVFDKGQVYAIEWLLEPGSVFEIWIDDVWFYE
jgi:hypothetical protein